PEHAQLVVPLGALGWALARKEELGEAERVIERALRIARKNYGADHPRTADVLTELGRVLRRRGQARAGAELLRHALAVHERGGNRWKVGEDLVQYGEALLADGQAAAAVGTLGRAIGLLADGPAAFALADARFALARAEWQSGRRAPARTRAEE